MLQPTEASTSQVKCQLTGHQKDILHQFTTWVTNSAPFTSRKDEDFLLMFVRACDFDLELSIVTLTKYYECRRKISWCANRGVNETAIKIAEEGNTYCCKDGNDQQMTVIVTAISLPKKRTAPFDEYMKLDYAVFDISLRRQNSQNNGLVWIIDCRNYSWWFTSHFFSLSFDYKFMNAFYLAAPMQVKHVFILNPPIIAKPIYKLFERFMDESLKRKITFCSSDWAELYECVPKSALPDEYGGTAGPVADHIKASLSELVSYSNFLKDDNKYGYQESNYH